MCWLLLQWELTLNRATDVIKVFPTHFTVERWLGRERTLSWSAKGQWSFLFCFSFPLTSQSLVTPSQIGGLFVVPWKSHNELFVSQCVVTHKWCLFRGPWLTGLELDADEASVMVSISVQLSWVHSLILTSRGCAHNLTHSSFDFKTIGWGSKKRSTWRWPTPTKLMQQTYFLMVGL